MRDLLNFLPDAQDLFPGSSPMPNFAGKEACASPTPKD